MTDFASQLEHNIDERIITDRNSKRNRLILKLKYIDGLTYDEIANLPFDKDLTEEERRKYKIINIDSRQIRRICKKYENRIYKGLKCP